MKTALRPLLQPSTVLQLCLQGLRRRIAFTCKLVPRGNEDASAAMIIEFRSDQLSGKAAISESILSPLRWHTSLLLFCDLCKSILLLSTVFLFMCILVYAVVSKQQMWRFCSLLGILCHCSLKILRRGAFAATGRSSDADCLFDLAMLETCKWHQEKQVGNRSLFSQIICLCITCIIKKILTQFSNILHNLFIPLQKKYSSTFDLSSTKNLLNIKEQWEQLQNSTQGLWVQYLAQFFKK